jgi:predicted transcriptional regulator
MLFLYHLLFIGCGAIGMKNRSNNDIIKEILDAANDGGGATKTKIMYQAFLSYAQLKEYLKELTETGLLNYDVDTRQFKPTEKGQRFLDTFNQISDVMKAQQQDPLQ